MKTLFRKYRWHPLLWALFAAYEIISIYTVHDKLANLENYLVHYAINISLAYTLSGWILPFSLGGDRRRIMTLAIAIPFALMLYLMASNFADRLLGYISEADFFASAGLDEIFIAATIWRGIYFMGIGSTVFLFQNRVTILQQAAEMQQAASNAEVQKSKLALELANARNAYLQAQINPHFMLSSLSYIYDHTRKSAPRIAQTVRYLSKLLRYALSSERGPEKINISEEIEQVENLLKITHIKKHNSYVRFDCEPGCQKAQIIPFVLLSLVENMLKHGDLSNATIPGSILVFRHDESLIIETKNLKSDGINDTGLHTGLLNIQQRLTHVYGNHASISYFSESQYFRTAVHIPFESYLPVQIPPSL